MKTLFTWKRFLQSRHVVIVLVVISLLGCTKDEDTTKPTTTTIPVELVATWTAQTAFVNGNPALLKDALDWQSGTVRSTFTFTSDGGFTYTEYSSNNTQLQVTTGTITVSGSTLTVRMLQDNGQTISPPKELGIAWSITTTQLNLAWTDTIGNIALQLTR
jgi:hypothetical protein